jgi:hypothetical protein
MHILKDNPCNKALLAEWGLKPMHKWLHERLLMFYAKLRLMPDCRLPKKAFNASWRKNGRVVVLPWHKHVGALLIKYGANRNYAAISEYSKCKSVIKSCVKSVWQDDLTLKSTLEMSTLKRYVDWVCPKLVETLSLKAPRPYLQAVLPTYGVELFMRVRLSCLPVKCRTARFRRNDDEDDLDVEQRGVDRGHFMCPACLTAEESLSHLLFDCRAAHDARVVMFDRIKEVPGCAGKLQACLSIQDEKERVCRFVSDDVWGSTASLQFVLPCIAQYLTTAWKLRCQCEHNGGRTTQHDLVLSASEMGRGADGMIAMADG